MQHKIELMLNPAESDNNELIKLNDELRSIVHEEGLTDDKLEELISGKIDEIMAVSKRVLKREWIVVKKGR